MKVELQRLLEESFRREDLKGIIFALGMDYDEFPESGRKSEITRELVEKCWASGRAADLVAEARRIFPEQDWPAIDAETAERTRLPFEPETVLIPAGEFVMGADMQDGILAIETPAHRVALDGYRLGKYAVTNEQYGAFVVATGHRPPKAKGSGWMGRRPRRQLDHPVRGVSWEDGLAYCAWLTGETGRTYRLPTEAEWEKGARGVDGRMFPWGNEWDKERCHYDADKTVAVDELPEGDSPFGCAQMVGNVWEWTNTIWGSGLDVAQFGYPYRPDDGREAGSDDLNLRRIVRGGGFADSRYTMRCTVRDRDLVSSTDSSYGFRVVETLG